MISAKAQQSLLVLIFYRKNYRNLYAYSKAYKNVRIGEKEARQEHKPLYLKKSDAPLWPSSIRIDEAQTKKYLGFFIAMVKKAMQRMNYLASKHSQLKKIAFESDDQCLQTLKQNRIQKQGRCRCIRIGIKGDSQKQININSLHQHLLPSRLKQSNQAMIILIVNLKKCVLFQHLENDEFIKLAQRMKRRVLQPGQIIIKEGEQGKELYIVESGILVCKTKGNIQLFKQYCKGQIFGELNLLYNNLAVATVTAIEKCNLFTLSRNDYAATMQYRTLKMLQQCEDLMEKVDIFSNLNLFERSVLYDNMQLLNLGPQKYIIQQGQKGDRFYIVAEGQLVAYKKLKEENRLVQTYMRGGYFGEFALLRIFPVQASIKTLTNVRLYYIDSECFARVLGSFEQILKRNEEKYERIASQLLKNLK